jgi:predicted Zn-ribbon and HTH transcriptional regulator
MSDKEKLISILSGSENPLKSGEISEMGNIDKKQVDKIIKELKLEEKIYSPKRCFYAIKE